MLHRENGGVLEPAYDGMQRVDRSSFQRATM